MSRTRKPTPIPGHVNPADIEKRKKLAEIRRGMLAALQAKPKDIAEYHRLGAEHRRILHLVPTTGKTDDQS